MANAMLSDDVSRAILETLARYTAKEPLPSRGAFAKLVASCDAVPHSATAFHPDFLVQERPLLRSVTRDNVTYTMPACFTDKSQPQPCDLELRDLVAGDADATQLALLEAICFAHIDNLPTRAEFAKMVDVWQRLLTAHCATPDSPWGDKLYGVFVDSPSDRRLVGLAAYNFIDRQGQPRATVHNSTEVYINQLMMAPFLHGLGGGHKMIEAAETLSRMLGRPTVAMTLRVQNENAVAIELYRRAGFKAIAGEARKRLARTYPGFTFMQRIVRSEAEEARVRARDVARLAMKRPWEAAAEDVTECEAKRAMV